MLRYSALRARARLQARDYLGPWGSKGRGEVSLWSWSRARRPWSRFAKGVISPLPDGSRESRNLPSLVLRGGVVVHRRNGVCGDVTSMVTNDTWSPQISLSEDGVKRRYELRETKGGLRGTGCPLSKVSVVVPRTPCTQPKQPFGPMIILSQQALRSL